MGAGRSKIGVAEMKHWFDLTDDERNAMTEKEKSENIRLSIENDIAWWELIKDGLAVRTRYETIQKLPLCHDSFVEP